MISLLKLFSRYLISGVFLFSGYQKLSVPLENFEEVLRAYEFFPEPTIFFISRIAPVAEIIIGIFLLIGMFTRLAYLGSVVFFSIFIFILSRSIMLKLPIYDCGCFGDAIQLPLHVTLGMDIVLLLLSVWLLFSKHTRFRLESSFLSI